MLKSADKNFKFCQIFRKNFVCSRTLRNLSVELVFYHFVNHILTNSTDFLTINSNYRPVCDGLKDWEGISFVSGGVIQFLVFDKNIYLPRRWEV